MARPGPGLFHQLLQCEHLWPNQFIHLTDAVALIQTLHDGPRHVLHPHRLKAGVCAGQGHHWRDGLQLGKQIHEGVVLAKDDAGAQHCELQAMHHAGLQGGLALRFAALVQGGAVQVCSQGAHMHQTLHALVNAGLRQAAGQHHMHLFKGGTVAMQDGDKVDHRVMTAHQCGQLHGVVHIGLHHRHHRQHLH